MLNYISFTIFNLELIPLIICFNFSLYLFMFGLVGIIWNKRSFLLMLLCIELSIFSTGLVFIFFSIFTYNFWGEVIALLVISSAAAETAIGLSLLIISYRLGDKINYNSLINLRG